MEPRCVTGPGAGPALRPVCGSIPRDPDALFNPVEAPLRLPGPAWPPAPHWLLKGAPAPPPTASPVAGRCSVQCWGVWDRNPRRKPTGRRGVTQRRFAGAGVGEWEEPAGLDLLRLGADKSRLRSSIPAAAAHPF